MQKSLACALTGSAVALFLLIPSVSSAATTCPNANERPATAADIPLMKSAGYPDSFAVVGNCWDPNSKYAGAAPGEAKQYLRSILCPPDGDNYGGKGPDGTIEGLDGQFSVCAAKFLKAAKDAGIDVCIREGARTVEKQNQYVARGVLACKKGAMCEHPRGIAIDVNVRPNVKSCASYTRLHQSAPQFGVHFYLGCKDAYHFVPLKGASCNGGGVIQPERDYDFPQYYSPLTPTSGITNPFRQALGLPTQPANPAITPSSSTPAPITSALPQPTQSQFCLPEYQCSGQTLTFKNSFCAVQNIQVCSAGCSAGACIAATSTATSTAQTATSTIDILSQIGGGVSTTPMSVATATPLSLILSIVQGSSIGTASSSNTVAHVPANTSILSVQPLSAQQTFTSTDLSQTPTSYTTFTSERSRLFAILENMRKVLVWAIGYLKPFEISRNRTLVIDGHDVTE